LRDPAPTGGVRIPSTIVRDRGRITLPGDVRRRLGLEDGDTLLLLATARGVEILPAAVIPRDQLWVTAEPVRDGLVQAGSISPSAPDRVVQTGRFRRRLARLSPRQRNLCRAAIRLLRRDPHALALRTRPVPGTGEIRESRFGYRGRILHRIEGESIVLLDVYGPGEVARLQRRALGRGVPGPAPGSTGDP
jgi:AbrB family looped-hinge helix DNA binding protein